MAETRGHILDCGDDIISYLIKAICIWQLGHKGTPRQMKLPEKEYNSLMTECTKRNIHTFYNGYIEGTLFKFRGIEVVRNTRNFIEFEN